MLVIAAMQMSLVDGHQQAENSLGPSSNDEQRQQDSQRPTTASAGLYLSICLVVLKKTSKGIK